MRIIDCDDVRPEERFAYWAETMRSSMYRTEVSRLRCDSAPFSGLADAWQVGDAVLGRQSSSGYLATRTERLIAEHALGMFIVGSPQTTSIKTEFNRFPVLHAAPGELLVFDSDIEWSAETFDGARYHAILIPRQRLYPYVGDSTLVRPRTIDAGNELHGMLGACFAEFAKLKDQSGPAAEAATQVLVHLLAVTCGLHPGDSVEVQQSLSTARLLRVSQLISANLHNPALNAAGIARHLGISVRRLHALYEPTGGTVTRQILAARLERARELLTFRQEMTVLDVALACGFYSNSTFYRCFADSFGVSPGEFRNSLRQRGGANRKPRGAQRDFSDPAAM